MPKEQIMLMRMLNIIMIMLKKLLPVNPSRHLILPGAADRELLILMSASPQLLLLPLVGMASGALTR